MASFLARRPLFFNFLIKSVINGVQQGGLLPGSTGRQVHREAWWEGVHLPRYRRGAYTGWYIPLFSSQDPGFKRVLALFPFRTLGLSGF